MSTDNTITSLSKLPNKKAALKDHLKFREVILGQDYIDLSVFKVQKKRRIFHLRSYWVDNLCKWYLGNFQQLVDQPKAVDWNTHSAQVWGGRWLVQWACCWSYLQYSKCWSCILWRYVNLNCWKTIIARMICDRLRTKVYWLYPVFSLLDMHLTI